MNPRRDWNEFWFSPIFAAPLGLFRIVFGFLVLLYGLMLFPDRTLWFTDRGVLTWAAVNIYNETGTPGPRPIHFLSGSLSEAWLLLFFIAFLLAAFCLMLGLWTRFAAVLVWLGLNAMHNRNPVIHNSGDLVMVAMAAYLVLAPAGAACSMDRLRRIWKGKEGETPPRIVPWAQRLMQLQVCVIYLYTFLSKMQGSFWQDGTAIYYPMHLPEMLRFPFPFLDGSSFFMLNLFTYGTLLIELSLATLIWAPRLRLYVLLGGTLLHLGIEYALNIPLFSFLMINSYILFLTEEDWIRVKKRLQKPLSAAKLQLVYDGQCGFCRSVLLIVRFFDVFRLVQFLDYHEPAELTQAPGVSYAEGDQAATIVDRHGRKWGGFYAFRILLWRLPALWALAPWLYLPGVPLLGNRAYRWIAANRSRLPVAPRYQRIEAAPREGALIH